MCNELVTKVNAIDSGKQDLEKEIEDVNKETTDSSKFIDTQDFNILTKINFNARITAE